MKMFRKLCDAYGIERTIAVATAAVRQAKNQRSFLDEVASVCGIKFKVLSAEEEAMYVYKGVINTMDIPKGIILEIGGGSTKIVYYNRRNLLAYETLPFGAITLTELFATDNLPPAQQADKKNLPLPSSSNAFRGSKPSIRKCSSSAWAVRSEISAEWRRSCVNTR